MIFNIYVETKRNIEKKVYILYIYKYKYKAKVKISLSPYEMGMNKKIIKKWKFWEIKKLSKTYRSLPNRS